MTEYAALSLAFLLDLLIGDPTKIPHPVRGIGWAVAKMENKLRALMVDADHGAGGTEMRRKKEERKAGVLLVFLIVGFTYLIFSIAGLSRYNAGLSNPVSIVSLVVFIYLVASTIATRDLIRSGQAVIDQVRAGNVEEARSKLGMIVGRDTGSLDETGVLKATIETVSENISDGVVAPMFYFALGGLPLAMAYKAVNTLDSMVGYNHGIYKHFGWASARLDDMANYVPARITGVLIVAATYGVTMFRKGVHAGAARMKNSQGRTGLYMAKTVVWIEKNIKKPDEKQSRHAFEIMRRDGRKHASPNSGIPEAAMAGALGVRVGGPSTYNGVVVDKPYIGRASYRRDKKKVYARAAAQSILIAKVTSLLGLFFALALIGLRRVLWN